MKKIFEKHETLCCILLIVIYVVANSYCVQHFGNTSSEGFVVNTILSVFLIGIIVALKRTAYYGLTSVTNTKQYGYFIPLMLIVTVNLWGGIDLHQSGRDILFHVLTMLNIGFIEEILFRGFLFKMMAKHNVKSAVIVSSLTFGIGHIINLLNGAEFISTIIQICSAISIGYLFVLIFYKSGSLIPGIITHSLVNALSVFYVEKPIVSYIASTFLIIAPLLYALSIQKNVKDTISHEQA